MSTLTVVTQVTVISVKRRANPVLRLSPLLRHALATAQPRQDGQPNLLPNSIPSQCCHDLFRCHSVVRWRVGDGRNKVFFCDEHVEAWWQAGHDVMDFSVERWRS